MSNQKQALPMCQRPGCPNRVKRDFVRRKGVRVAVRWCSLACVPPTVHQRPHAGPVFHEQSFSEEFAALQGRITRAQLDEQFRNIAKRYFRYGRDSDKSARYRGRQKQTAA